MFDILTPDSSVSSIYWTYQQQQQRDGRPAILEEVKQNRSLSAPFTFEKVRQVRRYEDESSVLKKDKFT